MNTITFETFLTGLMIVSGLTGLVTEAVKKILDEHGVKHVAGNTLAGIVSAVLSVLIGVGYVIIAAIPFTAQIVVCILALMLLSWLCAMVGYDKVLGCFRTGDK